MLEVARKEKIDGIVTNSEPAMPVSSYVGNKLGLPSNPYESILTLSRKDLFRCFLKNNGFNCPQSYDTDDYRRAMKKISGFRFPLMVKPIDSSGSRGVSRINSVDELKDAFDTAMNFSKLKHIIIEEFIERTHDYMIGGDIFVLNGEVAFWGLMNSMRNNEVNEFVPIGTSFPTFISGEQLGIIKNKVQKIIQLLNIKFGPFNLELMFNMQNELYIIEMNPRNGGNKIPEILKEATGVDILKGGIKTSLGFYDMDLSYRFNKKYMSTYVLHSDKNGILKNIIYDNAIKDNILKTVIDKNIGETVEKFNSADNLIGIVFLEFASLDEMKYKLNHIEELIKIDIQ